MKILYFYQHFSTPDGATGIRAYEFSKALIKNGHSVTMICGSCSTGNTGLKGPFKNGMRKGSVDDINIIEFKLSYSNTDTFFKRSLIFIVFATKSIKVILTRKYDIVFATSTPLTAAIPGIFAKLLKRKHFIFEVRDLWPELPKAMGVIKNPIVLLIMSCLEFLAYNLSDGCVGLSPGIVEGINLKLKTHKNVILIPNGCDLELFGNDTKLGAWWPKSIKDSDFIAVFAGAHGIANGLDAVIDAAIILKEKKLTHIKLVFIGEGKLKAKLIKRASANHLSNCIFLDAVSKSHLTILLKRANLGLMILANIPAFYYGTSPNKFFDYLASGLPVLINYPGWLADQIETNNCGICITPDDPVAFANGLVFAANNPDMLRKQALNSKKLAKNFDRQQLAQKFVDYIEVTYSQV